jgi:uracil-DNA glycosylase
MDVIIEPGWKETLKLEFEKPYFAKIVEFLNKEDLTGMKIYPPEDMMYNAFNCTPFDKVKVVIIGQDPYHGEGQANGLCFSVTKGTKLPPSLVNIFKEISSDLGVPITGRNGDLSHWASQGVLLLNASLTVRANEPMSHARIGWMQFTDAVIKRLSVDKKGLVFLLWGRFAQEKKQLIDAKRHRILEAAHPSPLSARNGFFGCRHFSLTNEILIKEGLSPIEWNPDLNT